jgi:hypothetical protein
MAGRFLPQRSGSERPAYERLAWYLDEAFIVPGARIRVRWDAILGLVPSDRPGKIVEAAGMEPNLQRGVKKNEVTR